MFTFYIHDKFCMYFHILIMYIYCRKLHNFSLTNSSRLIRLISHRCLQGNHEIKENLCLYSTCISFPV